jgi:DedD protein
MEEKNELNDIILNKSGSGGGNKKVLLAIATLAIILIIVVVIMNRINSDGTRSIPQAILPPEPSESAEIINDDPLFEPITVIEEDASESDNLGKIAKKIKNESLSDHTASVMEEDTVIVEPVMPKPAATETVSKSTPAPSPSITIDKGKYYIQVGSFAKYTPAKKFIRSITDNGYQYTYHQVVRSGKTINKVLIGPFDNDKEARKALPVIRSKIEPGAFLTKV